MRHGSEILKEFGKFQRLFTLQVWKSYFASIAQPDPTSSTKAFEKGPPTSERTPFPSVSPPRSSWITAVSSPLNVPTPVPHSRVGCSCNLFTSVFAEVIQSATLVLQARKERLREAKCSAPGHTASCARASPRTPISWVLPGCLLQKGSWKAKGNFLINKGLH